jgi:hypothetical protein
LEAFMRIPRRAALVAALSLVAAAPAAAQEPALPTSNCPPVAIDASHSVACDAWTSPNVSYLGTIQQDVGLTTGARVVASTPEMKAAGIPDRLFVHDAKNFTIYDISDPASPKVMGTIHPNISWEGEEVPTDGKVLVLADDYLIADPMCGAPAVGLVQRGKGCIQFFDVRDPANVHEVAAVPAQNHTAECAAPKEDATNDCEYVYGSYGTIIDARNVLKDGTTTIIGNWIDALKDQGVDESSCHHIRQLRPGVLLTACRPFSLISINAIDGGSPKDPVVLATGAAPGDRFIHSARWPRGGTDRFIFTGGENNFTGVCSQNQSTFDVYDATRVIQGGNDFGKPLDEFKPKNGTYSDGHAPAGELGCSTHWFMEHPSFDNGGLVALSQYENGVRFLEVTPEGTVKEVGYFVATASSSSSPKWAPDGKTLYSLDYHRGIDILRYNGDTYVPDIQGKVRHQKGKVRGTSADPPAAALKAARVGEAQLLSQLHSVGWFPGYCQLLAARYGHS